MPRIRRQVQAWLAVVLLAFPVTLHADSPPSSTPAANPNSIFNPNEAPVIVIRIGVHRYVLVPHSNGDTTTITAQSIASKAQNTTFSSIIASSVAGAASAESGELHIRGSHGQYTYYLDGAPLPDNISGSFSDLINPDEIQTLRVFDGGFPAEYGGQIAAIFDVTAKGGQTGKPGGSFTTQVEGNNTYDNSAQYGGTSGNLSYFVSGVKNSTDRRLDPETPTPIHDAGTDSVVFTKIDYRLTPFSRLTLDAAHDDSIYQIPNTPQAEAFGVNDIQRENGQFANLIYHNDAGASNVMVALYTHEARQRYDGSPGDLEGLTQENNQVAETFEDQSANYGGLRSDITTQVAKQHKLGYGFDAYTATGAEHFTIYNLTLNPDNSITPSTNVDNHGISGNAQSVYLEDYYTPAKGLKIDYGGRFDANKAQIYTQQFSPRVNVTYASDAHDTFHAYYDRLFQPTPIEDVSGLQGTTALGDAVASPIEPERDNFYEVGYGHDQHGYSETFATYYKTEQDVVDDTTLGSTQILAPFNVQRGYARGLEWTFGGPLVRDTSFYLNFARSWAKSDGLVSGGIITFGQPPGWFYDDHDQTNTGSAGVAYEHHGFSANMDAEYGSGFPYGQNAAGDVNYLRTPPHILLNGEVDQTVGSGQFGFLVINILNHGYVIKYADAFSGQQYGQARTLGVKYTQHF